MKELFNQFMEEFRPWVLAGRDNHNVFHASLGICANFKQYALFYKCSNFKSPYNFILLNVFDEKPFPFNQDSDNYFLEKDSGTIYQNPKRLAFIQNWEPLK